MSSTGALAAQQQATVDLDTLTSRWLGALAPATRTGYAADARAWLSYASSSGIDPMVAT